MSIQKVASSVAVVACLGCQTTGGTSLPADFVPAAPVEPVLLRYQPEIGASYELTGSGVAQSEDLEFRGTINGTLVVTESAASLWLVDETSQVGGADVDAMTTTMPKLGDTRQIRRAIDDRGRQFGCPPLPTYVEIVVNGPPTDCAPDQMEPLFGGELPFMDFTAGRLIFPEKAVVPGVPFDVPVMSTGESDVVSTTISCTYTVPAELSGREHLHCQGVEKRSNAAGERTHTVRVDTTMSAEDRLAARISIESKSVYELTAVDEEIVETQKTEFESVRTEP